LTDRLSFWIAAATVIVVAAAVAMTGLLWSSAIALIHVPMTLAVLLLGRATWRALHGRPWALRAGRRQTLAGVAGFAAPLLFLGAWTMARESGVTLQAADPERLLWRRRAVIGVRLTATQSGTNRTTMTTGWQEDAEQPLLPNAGLVVHAPDGVLGETFAAGLQGRWPAMLASLHGDVTLTCDAPFAPWPLYKSAAFKCKVTTTLQLHPVDQAKPVRSASLTMDVDSTWTMLGLASRRDFQGWIGGELAQLVREAIDEHVKKADKQ